MIVKNFDTDEKKKLVLTDIRSFSLMQDVDESHAVPN